MKRRTFSAEFKARIALAALRNDKTITELAAEHNLHPMQIIKWKKLALEQMAILFEDGRQKASKDTHEAEKNVLYEEIGRLKIQLDWIKKKCGAES
jgi:putative transposase